MQVERARTSLLFTAVTVLAIAGHLWQFSRGHSPALLLFSFAICCLLLSHRPSSSAKGDSASSAVVTFPGANHRHAPPAHVPAPQLQNAFTVDLEDYFHTEVASRSIPFGEWDAMPPRVEHSTHRLLDLLDESGTQATFFILGWVAQNHPRLVREVARRGHEIACHSYRHRLVFNMSSREFRQDTLAAKRRLEDVTGERVLGYRAPSFSITPGTEWAFDTLAELGFEYDSSVNPVWHRVYAHPSAPRHPYRHSGSNLLELPIASISLAGVHLPIGGGAYLRLLPYWYLRGGLALVNHLEREPATLYVHPWEIDSFCPLIPEDLRSRIRQTWGTSTMEKKLTELLRSTTCGPIRDVYQQHFMPSPLPEKVDRARENALAGV